MVTRDVTELCSATCPVAVKDGRVLVPIMVWNDTIVDGHNRYNIVQKHPEIPFEVKEISFADKYEAIVWICRSQLGRRNLTPEQKAYLIGRQYEAEKAAHGGNRFASSYQNGNLVSRKEKTAEKVAAEHNVGTMTVHRAANFAKGVDEIESQAPGTKGKILSGEVPVPKCVVAKIPKMEQGEKEEEHSTHHERK